MYRESPWIPQLNAEHYMHVEKLPKEMLGQEAHERIRGTVPRGHTAPGVTPLNISHSEKPHGSQSIELSIWRDFL